MKFKVTMKDPDTLHDAITDAVRAAVDALPDLDEEEKEAVIDKRQESVSALCSEWFEYGEYLTVEIDTDAGTCVVCPK